MSAYFYIFRVILVSFIVAIVIGPMIITILRRLKVGQSIREEGPKSHIGKSGTPTMGGVIIIIAIIFSVLTSGCYDKEVWVILFSIIGFGLVGFIDDYKKVVLKRNLGLRAYQKILGQLFFAFFLALYSANYSIDGTRLLIPFVDMYIDLGPFYIPFTVFVIIGTVNSVNLTDGLDGLASGVTLIVMAAFSLIASSLIKFNASYYGVSIVSAAISGACLGFLKHNAHPAKVFMGDTGSLALGGAVAAVAVVMNLTIFIPIIGAIYFLEAVSVIIQVFFFKTTGRRIFKMSPLHHHFEESGWKETKVVATFWIVTVLMAFVGIYAM